MTLRAGPMINYLRRVVRQYICHTQDDNALSTIIKPDLESNAAANVMQRGPIFIAFWDVTPFRQVEILSVPLNFDKCLPDYTASHPRNSAHVEYESKSDTNNNMGNWNHLKIIQTVSEQHTGKARNQGTTIKSYWALTMYFRK